MFEWLFRKSGEINPDPLFDIGRLPPSVDYDKHPISYHYCNLPTFLSLINNKAFWLSDINTMNDFSETHWAYDQFIAAANSVLNYVGEPFVDEYDKYVSTSQLRLLPLICCFSTNGDLLSQWRAYADDGMGVAVGFDSSKLESLNVRSVAVVYDIEEQRKHFSDIIRATYDVYKELPDGERQEFLRHCATMSGANLCCFKNPAFQEEQEVRIVRTITVFDENERPFFKDHGGDRDTKYKSAESQRISFRARSGGIVSYLELPFDDIGKDFIKEVVIGPRSMNNGVEVAAALSANGFKDVRIRKSSATYR